MCEIVKEISTLSVKVTEEINNKNLLSFIRTSILHSELSFSKHTYFSFSYILSTQTYEILFYDKASDNTIIEPLIFSNFLTVTGYDLVVICTNKYFVIFKEKKIILFKNIKNTTKTDIEIYVKQIYKIDDLKIIYQDEKALDRLQETPINVVGHQEYSLYSKKSYQYFLLYVTSSFLIFIVLLYINSIENKKNLKSIPTEKKIIKVVAPFKPINKTIELFQYIALNDIQIEKIRYSKNSIETTLFDKNKQNILNFVNLYKNRITITSFKYHEDKQLYFMEVTFEF